MKKKNVFFLFLFLLMCMLTFDTCKKSSDDTSSATSAPETPLITEGQIVTSGFYINDVLREELTDTVVNLGSKELPALFYMRQHHTLDGAPIAQGNRYSNVFRSLTRGEHYAFIILWGRLLGLTIDINDTSAASVKSRQLAFFELAQYLMNNDIDFPLLVALSHDTTELRCAKRWVDAATNLSASGVILDKANTPDNLFRALEMTGNKISDLSKAIGSTGMTEQEFLFQAQHRGVDLGHTLMQIDSPKQFWVVCLVVAGVKMFAAWTLRFITHGQADPNLPNEYASYLNQNDSNVMNYIHARDTLSPKYKVAYCTLATAEFYIETYYHASHPGDAGLYVNRVGMIVTKVVCSWGMHVNGKTDFHTPDYLGSQDDPIAVGDGTVTISYGDCCCNKRTAYLGFQVTGDLGYKQELWDPSK